MDGRPFFSQSPDNELAFQLREIGFENALVAADVVSMRPYQRSSQACLLPRTREVIRHRSDGCMAISVYVSGRHSFRRSAAWWRIVIIQAAQRA
jgi:hypothetical protein